jgi:integrase/recombinase XerD
MKTKISFSDAVDGYLLAASARHLSQHTIADYVNTFRKFVDFLADDLPISEITSKHIEAFLASQEVSKKTVKNYHVGLSALWCWAVSEGLAADNVVRKIIPPKPEKKAVKPYSEEDVRAMLGALSSSRSYARPGKRESRHGLPNESRNRAVILLLLDTGIRAEELCTLRINQVDLRNRRITVFGKGSKERIIPFCARTGQAIWRYLKEERKDEPAGALLFANLNGTELDRSQLLKTINRIAERAGVYHANVHRFRHTFAINFLRNGGDPYALQMALGHSTMEMVRHYLEISNADLERNHKLASPVDNWRL